MTQHIKEVDLFEPIEMYFKAQGYDVYGEVRDCDVVARKDEKLVIIELKKTFQLDVIVQAAKRQRLTEDVYIAVLAPKISFHSRKKSDLRHLIRRLGLGLLIVSFKDGRGSVEQVMAPKPFNRQQSMAQSKRSQQKLHAEIDGRHKNLNIGGSHQSEIMTAYREMNIFIAVCLDQYGPLSAKQLQEIGTGKNTYSILYKNYYGWFTRVDKGVYDLTLKGKDTYQMYGQVVAYYREKIQHFK